MTRDIDKTNVKITVKISGNPKAGGGYADFIVINEPKFNLEDKVYGGTSPNQYFFVIKTESTRTMYKLIHNNASSYGASRPGSLVFAITIPQYYKIKGDKTPYDILLEIKDKFIKLGMSSSISGKLEYNEGLTKNEKTKEVTSEIQRIVDNYTLYEQEGPWCIMRGTKQGAMELSADKIRELSADVQYPEMRDISELIVAEHIHDGNYKMMSNLEVPRKVNYKIYLDGSKKPVKEVSDLDERINLTPNENKVNRNHYSVDPVEFTLKELLDKTYEHTGVELNPHKEEVNVTTKGYFVKPRRVKMTIKFVDEKKKPFDDATNYFKKNFRDITLKVNGKEEKLNDSLTFLLEGPQLDLLTSPAKFNLFPLNDFTPKYTIDLPGEITPNEDKTEADLIFIAKKKEPKKSNPAGSPFSGQGHISSKGTDPSKDSQKVSSGMFLIQLISDKLSGACTVKISGKYEEKSYKLLEKAAEFSRNNEGKYYTSFCIDQRWAKSYNYQRLKIEVTQESQGDHPEKSWTTYVYPDNLQALSPTIFNIDNWSTNTHTPKNTYRSLLKSKGPIIAGCAVIIIVVALIGYLFIDDYFPDEGKYSCEYCEVSYDKEIDLKDHLKETHTLKIEEATNATVYGKTEDIKSVKRYINHLNKQIEDLYSMSDYSYPSGESHTEVEDAPKQPLTKQEKKFKCDRTYKNKVCGQAFNSQKELNKHILDKHPWKCKECDKKFKTQKELQNHMGTDHKAR